MELDEDELADDELAVEEDGELDDDAVEDDEDDDDDDDADRSAPTTRSKKRRDDDEDDDDELLSPDDVEADLDRILKDRMVTAEDDDDEDDESETDDRSDPGDRIQPKRLDEQLCGRCFLLVRAGAPACPSVTTTARSSPDTAAAAMIDPECVRRARRPPSCSASNSWPCRRRAARRPPLACRASAVRLDGDPRRGRHRTRRHRTHRRGIRRRVARRGRAGSPSATAWWRAPTRSPRSARCSSRSQPRARLRRRHRRCRGRVGTPNRLQVHRGSGTPWRPPHQEPLRTLRHHRPADHGVTGPVAGSWQARLRSAGTRGGTPCDGAGTLRSQLVGQTSRPGSEPQRPFQLGWRFSMKAARPSCRSSDLITVPNAASDGRNSCSCEDVAAPTTAATPPLTERQR